MEKKEFLKKESSIFPEIKPKVVGFSSRIFGIIKFILGICLLPFAYSGSRSFLNEFSAIEKALQNYFWTGVISFLIVYLFVWEPARVYARGQQFLEVIFKFFAPLVKVAPYVLPIWAIIFCLIYGLISLIAKTAECLNYFLFLFGFSITLHLVFGAKSLRTKETGFLRGNYIFGFSFVYILSVTLAAFCLNLIFKEFSFVNFFNNSFQIAKGILSGVFEQLFLRYRKV